MCLFVHEGAWLRTLLVNYTHVVNQHLKKKRIDGDYHHVTHKDIR